MTMQRRPLAAARPDPFWVRFAYDPAHVTALPRTAGYAADDPSKYQLVHQMTRIIRDKGALARDDRLDVPLHRTMRPRATGSSYSEVFSP